MARFAQPQRLPRTRPYTQTQRPSVNFERWRWWQKQRTHRKTRAPNPSWGAFIGQLPSRARARARTFVNKRRRRRTVSVSGHVLLPNWSNYLVRTHTDKWSKFLFNDLFCGVCVCVCVLKMVAGLVVDNVRRLHTASSAHILMK